MWADLWNLRLPTFSSSLTLLFVCSLVAWQIYYFLDDDTIQVIEPRTYNSGIPQGGLIRRHRIPLEAPCQDEYFNLLHFNVGCEVTLYGKTFFICSCDPFTRNFLNRLGIPVPMDMQLPPDMATEKRKDVSFLSTLPMCNCKLNRPWVMQIKTSQFARKPHQCLDTRGPFLKHDRHVLRFWLVHELILFF